MRVDDLNEVGLERLIRGVAKLITDFSDHTDESGKRDLARALAPVLDELDAEDFFGSEGWKRAAGLE